MTIILCDGERAKSLTRIGFSPRQILWKPGTEANIDNALSLGNDLLRTTFFKIGRTV
jgi:hypothetical protein